MKRSTKACTASLADRNISRFLEGLARPHILPAAIDEAYRQMAADEGARRKPRNGRKGWWET